MTRLICFIPYQLFSYGGFHTILSLAKQNLTKNANLMVSYTQLGVQSRGALVGIFFEFSNFLFLYPPQTVFVGGYTVFTLSECPSVHPSVRPTDRVSVTFCFFNNFKNH